MTQLARFVAVLKVSFAGLVLLLSGCGGGVRANDAQDQCLQRGPTDLAKVGNGILRQCVTGIEWTQQNLNYNFFGLNWGSAVDACASKGREWRLPTVVELLSLYDKEGGKKSRCGQFTCQVSPEFKLDGAQFWSETESENTEMWIVFFDNGQKFSSPKNGTTANVLCVRSTSV